jgi:hypothetical protein
MIHRYTNCVEKRRRPTRQPAVAWNWATEKKYFIAAGADRSLIVDDAASSPTTCVPQSAAAIVKSTIAAFAEK